MAPKPPTSSLKDTQSNGQLAPEPTIQDMASQAETDENDKTSLLENEQEDEEDDAKPEDEQEQDDMLSQGEASDLDLDLDFDEPAPPLPPDGGYGWVIVAVSFVVNLLVDGMCYMGGLLYIELLDYFNQPKGKTQWVHTLVPAVYLTIGPFVGALVNKYGCRKITIIGSLVSATCFILSSFAQNVEMLIVTYGVLIGIGFGFMYLPAVCFVSYYFDRKRALATGIAVCGSGIGTFIFPPLMNILLNCYGWRGSLWLMAGFSLNCCVCGALMRPLSASKPKPKKLKDQKKTREQKKKEKKMAKEIASQKSIIMQKILEQKNRQRTISTGSLDGTVITTNNKLVKDPDLLKVILQSETISRLRQNSLNSSAPDLRNGFQDKNTSNKVQTGKGLSDDFITTCKSQPSSPKLMMKRMDKETPTPPTYHNKHLENVKERDGPNNHLYQRQTSGVSTGSQNNLRLRQISENHTDSNASFKQLSIVQSAAELQQKRKDMSRIMYRQDIFYTGSVTSIPEYKSNPDMNQYVQSVVGIPGTALGTDNKCAPFTNVLYQMFDLSLFKSVTFVVLSGNSFFSFLGFFVPFMFVPDLAKIQGASGNQAALLISILGICNTFGRLGAGWLADRPWADCLVIQNVALITGGIATAMVPFYVNYALLAAYCCVFGTCMAMFIALRSIVTAEMMGIQKLNNAFGLTIFFQGIAGIAGSPLAGTVFDATGSYAVSFVIAGSFITFSGLICLPLRRIANWENAKTADYDLNGAMYNTVDMDDLPVPEVEDDAETKEVKFMENQNQTENSNEILNVV